MNAIEHPPSKINGKANPAYGKWYRENSNAYKLWLKNNPKYQTLWRKKNPEKYRITHLKGEAKKYAKRRELGLPKKTETKCVECGIIYERKDAKLKGHKLFPYTGGGSRCICVHCQ